MLKRLCRFTQLLLLCLFCSNLLLCFSASISSIHPFESPSGSPTTSIFGGSTLQIEGDGFNPTGHSNIQVNIDHSRCQVIDQYSSNSTIVCIIEEALMSPGLFEVQVTVDGTSAACSSGSMCLVEASESMTPFLLNFFPVHLFKEDRLEVTGILRAKDLESIEEVSIDQMGLRIIEEESLRGETSLDSIQKLTLLLPDNLEPGNYFIKAKGGPGTGFSFPLSSGYDVTLTPHIHSVTPSSLSSYGQLFSIKGSGFSKDSKVFIGSHECHTTYWAPDTIECLFEDLYDSLGEESGVFLSGFGVQLEQIDENGENSRFVVLPSFEGRKSKGVLNETYEAYFIPKKTGIHSFIYSGTGDDFVRFSVGEAVGNVYFDFSESSLSMNSSFSSNFSFETQFKELFTFRSNESEWKEERNGNVWRYQLANEEVYLSSGEIYPVKAERQGDSSEFFRFGLKQPATETDGANCVPFSFEVSLENLDFQNEVWQVDIFNVESGNWEIITEENGSTLHSGGISYNEDPEKLQESLLGNLGIDSQITLGYYTADETLHSAFSGSNTSGYRFTISLKAPNQGSVPSASSLSLQAKDSSKEVQITLLKSQAQSESVHGLFRLFIGTKWTGWLETTISVEKLWNELVVKGFLGKKTRIFRKGFAESGYQFIFEVFDEEFAGSTVAVDGSRASMGAKIQEVSSFDCKFDLFEAIPSEQLIQLSSAPALTIKGSFGKGVCEPGACLLEIWQPGTKVQETIWEKGDDGSQKLRVVLTDSISLKGINEIEFLMENEKICQIDLSEVGNEEISEMTCEFEGLLAGVYKFYVRVPAFGFLPLLFEDSTTFSISPKIETSETLITPAFQDAKALLELTGSSFNDQVSLTTVYIGSDSEYPCQITELSQTSLKCLTFAPLEQKLSIFVVMKSKVTILEKSFRLSITNPRPMITSLNRTQSSPFEFVPLQIQGHDFGDSFDSTRVYLFRNDFNDSGIFEECPIESLSENEIVCLLGGNGVHGTFFLVVSRTGYGSSIESILDFDKEEPDTSVLYEMNVLIYNSSLSEGSAAGGSFIKIQGENFPCFSDLVDVHFGEIEDQRCQVVSISSNELKCKTLPLLNMELIDQDLQLKILVQSQDVASFVNGLISFKYSSELTPTIDSLTPLAIRNSQPFIIHVSGVQGLGPVLLIGHETIILDYDDQNDYYTGIFPSLEANPNLSLELRINSDNGNALNENNFTFNNFLAVDSMSTNKMSQGGGYLNISGSGFSQNHLFLFGTEEKVNCTLTSLSKTQVICLVGQFNQNADLPLVIYDGDSFSRVAVFLCEDPECFLQFSRSITPFIASFEPSASASGQFNLTIHIEDTETMQPITEQSEPTVFLQDAFNSARAFFASQILSFDYSSLVFTASFSTIPIGNYRPFISIGSWGLSLNLLSSELLITADPNEITGSVSSSYHGGALLTLKFNGEPLSLPNDSSVLVCGFQCTDLKVEMNQMSCKTPILNTRDFQETYQWAEPREFLLTDNELDVSVFWDSNERENEKVFLDDSGDSFYSSNGASCFVGVEFGKGKEVQMGSVSFLVPSEVDLSSFIGMEFQASSDGVNWEVLQAFNVSLAPNWNYFGVEETKSIVKMVRFLQNGANSKCQISTMKFTGFLFKSTEDLEVSRDNSITCEVEIETESGFSVGVLPNVAVKYEIEKSFSITEVSPSQAEASGGTNVTITFDKEGLESSGEVPDVYFNGVLGTNCFWEEPENKSTSVLNCMTAKHEAKSFEESLAVEFSFGIASSSGVSFEYIYKWSSAATWDGQIPPNKEGQVTIPKGKTVVLEESIKLEELIIEGVLLFDPENPIELRCQRIFVVNEGKLQIGTKENPRDLKNPVTITFYEGNTKETGIIDGQGLLCKQGKLEMYGYNRRKWVTSLNKSANAGEFRIKLKDGVDWEEGEVVVIAPKGLSGSGLDELEISGVFSDGKVVAFVGPLQFNHPVFSQSINGTQVVYSPEVAVLNRSIVIRADSESVLEQKGCFVSIGESCSVKLDSIEVYHAGHFGQAGKYPIHFEYMGNALNSFIKHSSIHHSFNRGISIQGTSYLTVEDNLIYDTKGHSLLLEDGSEQFNLIKGNIGLKTQRSWATSSFDPEPATFLIRNPNNFLVNNTAIASESFGFWFDLPEHPGGVYSLENLCVRGLSIGSFDGNAAHSNSKAGLLIFKELVPKRSPCAQLLENESLSDQFVPNSLTNFKAFWNSGPGAAVSNAGQLLFKNWALLGNGVGVDFGFLAFEELSQPENNEEFLFSFVTIENSKFLEDEGSQPKIGIKVPKGSYCQIDDCFFENFLSYSHCLNGSFVTSSLAFENASEMLEPTQNDFYMDLDGSLSNSANGVWILPQLGHLMGDECTWESGFVTCPKEKHLRKITVAVLEKDSGLNGSIMGLSRLSKPFWSDSGFSQILPEEENDASWSFIVASGEIYRVHWEKQTDFKGLTVKSEELTELDVGSGDFRVYFQLDYFNEMDSFSTGGKEISKDDLADSPLNSRLSNGDYVNDKEAKSLLVIMKESGDDSGEQNEGTLIIQEKGCSEEDCSISINQPSSNPSKVILWSDPDSWDSGSVPLDGEHVQIKPEWSMLLDESTGNLASLEILGTLIVESSFESLKLSAKNINIRENAQFLVGTESEPFEGSFTIDLNASEDDLPFDFAQNSSSYPPNVLMVSGDLKIFGASAQKAAFTRLSSKLVAGSKSISIRDADTYWEAGDEIVVSTTDYLEGHTEKFKIESINSTEIELDKKASYSHFGSTKLFYTNEEIGELDLAAEVVLLSRNVVIKANDGKLSSLGGAIVNEKYSIGQVEIEGKIHIQGVELVNMGQKDTELGALNFISNKVNRNVVQNCSIHDSNGSWIIASSSSFLSVSNNVFYSAVQSGIKFINEPTKNSLFLSNILITVANLTNDSGNDVIEVSSGIIWAASGTLSQANTSIRKNIIADAQILLAVPLSLCSEPNNVIQNTLHNGRIGYLGLSPTHSSSAQPESLDDSNSVSTTDDSNQDSLDSTGAGQSLSSSLSDDASEKCLYVSEVVAYKMREDGIIAYTNSNQLFLERSILAANKNSVTLNQGQGSLGSFASLTETRIERCVFYGYTDLTDADQTDLSGIRVSLTTEQFKGYFPKPNQLPYFKPESTSAFNSRMLVRECSVINHTYLKNVTFMQLNYFAGDGSSLVSIESLLLDGTTKSDLFYFPSERNFNCHSILNCTGFSNVLITLKEEYGTYDLFPLGTQSQTPGNLTQCSRVPSWDGFNCTRPSDSSQEFLLLGIKASQESEWIQSFSPLLLSCPEIQFESSLNSGVDWYDSSLIYPNAFQVILPSSSFYLLSSSSPFLESTIFSLSSTTNSLHFIVLQIALESSKYGMVFQNGVPISPSIYGEISQEKTETSFLCGMNSYNPEIHSLKMVITTEENCLLTVQMKEYASIEIELNIDLADFQNDFQPFSFIQKLSEFLDWDPEYIHLNRVEEGSTRLFFYFLADSLTNERKSALGQEIALGIQKELLDFGFNVKMIFEFSDSGDSGNGSIIYEDKYLTEYIEIYVEASDLEDSKQEEDSSGASGEVKFILFCFSSLILVSMLLSLSFLLLWLRAKKLQKENARNSFQGSSAIEPKDLTVVAGSPGAPQNDVDFVQEPRNIDLELAGIPSRKSENSPGAHGPIKFDLPELKESRSSSNPGSNEGETERNIRKALGAGSQKEIQFSLSRHNSGGAEKIITRRTPEKHPSNKNSQSSKRSIDIPPKLHLSLHSDDAEMDQKDDDVIIEEKYLEGEEYQLSPITGKNKKLKKEGSFSIKEMIFGGKGRASLKRKPTLKKLASFEKTPMVGMGGGSSNNEGFAVLDEFRSDEMLNNEGSRRSQRKSMESPSIPFQRKFKE